MIKALRLLLRQLRARGLCGARLLLYASGHELIKGGLIHLNRAHVLQEQLRHLKALTHLLTQEGELAELRVELSRLQREALAPLPLRRQLTRRALLEALELRVEALHALTLKGEVLPSVREGLITARDLLKVLALRLREGRPLHRPLSALRV